MLFWLALLFFCIGCLVLAHAIGRLLGDDDE